MKLVEWTQAHCYSEVLVEKWLCKAVSDAAAVSLKTTPTYSLCKALYLLPRCSSLYGHFLASPTFQHDQRSLVSMRATIFSTGTPREATDELTPFTCAASGRKLGRCHRNKSHACAVGNNKRVLRKIIRA